MNITKFRMNVQCKEQLMSWN